MTAGAFGIVSLALIVCYLFNVIQMFRKGNTMMGIVFVITMFCGIGYFIMLIYGWLKVSEYSMPIVMIIYTIAFLLAGPLGFLSGLAN